VIRPIYARASFLKDAILILAKAPVLKCRTRGKLLGNAETLKKPPSPLSLSRLHACKFVLELYTFSATQAGGWAVAIR
jgi:hypothetical protein